MTYDPAAQNAALLLRTVRGIADFSGRSRRTEVGFYWIAASLVRGVLGFVIATHLPWKQQVIVADAIGLIVTLPFFALCARRLHDMNQSGWWALIFPMAALVYLPRAIAQIASNDRTPRFPDGFTLIDGVSVLTLIASLAISFVPGTIGPNRFGPDPREDWPDTQAG